MALSANRDTLERFHPLGVVHGDWVGTDSKEFYVGALICIVSSTGKIEPGTAATGRVAIGRCEQRVTTGTSNTLKPRVKSGLFKWANNGAGSDPVVAADEGGLCYIEDDFNVCHTATGKSAAGRVYKVDSDGVWVLTNYPSNP